MLLKREAVGGHKPGAVGAGNGQTPWCHVAAALLAGNGGESDRETDRGSQNIRSVSFTSTCAGPDERRRLPVHEMLPTQPLPLSWGYVWRGRESRKRLRPCCTRYLSLISTERIAFRRQNDVRTKFATVDDPGLEGAQLKHRMMVRPMRERV